MNFSGLAFYAFLPAVLGLFVLLEKRRVEILLYASLAFYAMAGGWPLLALLLLCGCLTWLLGGRVAASQGGRRRAWLWLGLALNLGVMAAAKTQVYWRGTAGLLSFLGVSYYLFQCIAYLADLHWKVLKQEPALDRFLLYLAFFPRVVQGPVERPGPFMRQLESLPGPDEQDLRSGALRFAWGFFKKAVIAERAAGLTERLLGPIQGRSGPYLYLGALAYLVQLYFDFSGYTDMALGCARLFGLRLSENFNAPFLGTSSADYWRRWHITFTTWVRDYMFQPLQMEWRKRGMAGTLMAMMVVFAAVGLWHRIEAGHLVWGLLQGTFMCTGILIRPLQRRFYGGLGLEGGRLQRCWRIALTFHMTAFALLFTRAATWALVGGIVEGLPQGWSQWREAALTFDNGDALVVAGGIALAVGALALKGRWDLLSAPRWARWSTYYALALAIFFGAHFFGLRQFIYAQF